LTATYYFTQFEHSALRITGGTTFPIDTNKNSLFDRLDVSLDVDILTSGIFHWSATLRDAHGTEIDFDSGSQSFSIGSNSFILSFTGVLISNNRVNGPFFIGDLLLFGAGESLVESMGVYTTDPLLANMFESNLESPDPCNDPNNFCKKGKSGKNKSGKSESMITICYKNKETKCISPKDLEKYLGEMGSKCGQCP